MYEIVKLVATSHGYTVRQTEYALMQRCLVSTSQTTFVPAAK